MGFRDPDVHRVLAVRARIEGFALVLTFVQEDDYGYAAELGVYPLAGHEEKLRRLARMINALFADKESSRDRDGSLARAAEAVVDARLPWCDLVRIALETIRKHGAAPDFCQTIEAIAAAARLYVAETIREGLRDGLGT